MTEEEFAVLSIQGKWEHLRKTMDYIMQMDSKYSGANTAFDMRRRLNPHHPKKDVAQETKRFKEEQRNLRVDQYQRWAHIKNLYAAHRDELSNTLGDATYEEHKGYLERVFTMEVDDALRDIIDGS